MVAFRERRYHRPIERSGGQWAEDEERVSVLVVSQGSTVWGAQLRLMDLAGPLAERGVVLTSPVRIGGPLREHWKDAICRIWRCDLPDHAGLRRDGGRRAGVGQIVGELGAVLRAVPRIRRMAKGFDVVLSFSLPSHLEVAIAGRLARRPTVIEVVDIVRPGLGRRCCDWRHASRRPRSSTATQRPATSTVMPVVPS